MRSLYNVTAVVEVGAGLALVCSPAFAVELLAGEPFDSPVGATVARIAGAAVLGLGVACWLARTETQSRAATGLIAAMVVYNAGACGALAYGGIGLGLHGFLLWPGVVLHAAMGVWCVAARANRFVERPAAT